MGFAKEYDWLAALVDFLEVEGAVEWLGDPCPELGDEAPLALCSTGRQEEVSAAVEAMIEGEQWGAVDPDEV